MPECLFHLDNKLIRKILNGLEVGCCICGWREGTCDYHHVDGRKIRDADSEHNIAMLCPNCHRLVHERKIEKGRLTPLSKSIGKKWKNFVDVFIIDNKAHYKYKE